MEILAKKIITLFKEKNLTLSLAESCTGGLVSSLITKNAGSSAVFKGSFVTYSYEAKELLGIKKQSLEKFSATSLVVAKEMAFCAKDKLNTNVAVSITGNAGPSVDKDSKVKIGTVFFGFASDEKNFEIEKFFTGNREEIIEKSSAFALNMILENLS